MRGKKKNVGERGRQRRFLLCVCVLRALVCCVGMQPCGRCVRAAWRGVDSSYLAISYTKEDRKAGQ